MDQRFFVVMEPLLVLIMWLHSSIHVKQLLNTFASVMYAIAHVVIVQNVVIALLIVAHVYVAMIVTVTLKRV